MYGIRKKFRFKKRFFKVKLRRRRYNFRVKSKYALTGDDGVDVMTLPIKGRRQLFRNFYFSKLWIMHIFGWLILKINILIPKLHGKSKILNITNKPIITSKSAKINNNSSKLKKFPFIYNKNFNNKIYKSKYNFIKNYFFYNNYLSKNNSLLDNYHWF